MSSVSYNKDLWDKSFQGNVNGSNGNGGIDFFGLLTILFIGLKLTKVIDWSWAWVLSPIWIWMLIYVAIVSIALIVFLRKRGK